MTLQPADQTVILGQAATFTAAASGTPTPTVQWQVSTNGGNSFIFIAGATATTYSFVPTLAQSGNRYRAVFSNFGGSSTTSAATLTVNQAPAVATASSATFTVGSSGTFNVTATGTPTPTLTKTGALPSGVTFVDNHNGTATLSGTPAAGTGGTYAISITAANGVNPDASQAFTLTVNQAPAVTSQPTNQTVTFGQTASFSAAASGSRPPRSSGRSRQTDQTPSPTSRARRARPTASHRVCLRAAASTEPCSPTRALASRPMPPP